MQSEQQLSTHDNLKTQVRQSAKNHECPTAEIRTTIKYPSQATITRIQQPKSIQDYRLDFTLESVEKKFFSVCQK